MTDLSEVHPNIFISSVETAFQYKQLKDKGITHIINLSGFNNGYPPILRAESPDIRSSSSAPRSMNGGYPENFNYLRIDIDDLETENISQYFPLTTEFIHNALDSGGKVLVHCIAGISRSPTIVIAYLISKLYYTPQIALKKLREIRPIINPNDGFRKQLIEFSVKY